VMWSNDMTIAAELGEAAIPYPEDESKSSLDVARVPSIWVSSVDQEGPDGVHGIDGLDRWPGIRAPATGRETSPGGTPGVQRRPVRLAGLPRRPAADSVVGVTVADSPADVLQPDTHGVSLLRRDHDVPARRVGDRHRRIRTLTVSDPFSPCAGICQVFSTTTSSMALRSISALLIRTPSRIADSASNNPIG
jgi:hypothetical protein